MGFGMWDHAALKGHYLVLREWKDGRERPGRACSRLRPGQLPACSRKPTRMCAVMRRTGECLRPGRARVRSPGEPTTLTTTASRRSRRSAPAGEPCTSFVSPMPPRRRVCAGCGWLAPEHERRRLGRRLFVALRAAFLAGAFVALARGFRRPLRRAGRPWSRSSTGSGGVPSPSSTFASRRFERGDEVEHLGGRLGHRLGDDLLARLPCARSGRAAARGTGRGTSRARSARPRATRRAGAPSPVRCSVSSTSSRARGRRAARTSSA